MNWNDIYTALDFLNKYSLIADAWISPTLTLIIRFNDWDFVAQRYESLDRYFYYFRDGTQAYGQ